MNISNYFNSQEIRNPQVTLQDPDEAVETTVKIEDIAESTLGQDPVKSRTALRRARRKANQTSKKTEIDPWHDILKVLEMRHGKTAHEQALRQLFGKSDSHTTLLNAITFHFLPFCKKINNQLNFEIYSKSKRGTSVYNSQKAMEALNFDPLNSEVPMDHKTNKRDSLMSAHLQKIRSNPRVFQRMSIIAFTEGIISLMYSAIIFPEHNKACLDFGRVCLNTLKVRIGAACSEKEGSIVSLYLIDLLEEILRSPESFSYLSKPLNEIASLSSESQNSFTTAKEHIGVLHSIAGLIDYNPLFNISSKLKIVMNTLGSLNQRLEKLEHAASRPDLLAATVLENFPQAVSELTHLVQLFNELPAFSLSKNYSLFGDDQAHIQINDIPMCEVAGWVSFYQSHIQALLHFFTQSHVEALQDKSIALDTEKVSGLIQKHYEKSYSVFGQYWEALQTLNKLVDLAKVKQKEFNCSEEWISAHSMLEFSFEEFYAIPATNSDLTWALRIFKQFSEENENASLVYTNLRTVSAIQSRLEEETIANLSKDLIGFIDDLQAEFQFLNETFSKNQLIISQLKKELQEEYFLPEHRFMLMQLNREKEFVEQFKNKERQNFIKIAQERIADTIISIQQLLESGIFFRQAANQLLKAEFDFDQSPLTQRSQKTRKNKKRIKPKKSKKITNHSSAQTNIKQEQIPAHQELSDEDGEESNDLPLPAAEAEDYQSPREINERFRVMKEALHEIAVIQTEEESGIRREELFSRVFRRKDLEKILRDRKWQKIRQKGSHQTWQKTEEDGIVRNVTVAGHNETSEIPRGTLNAIAKQAGLFS